MGSKTIEIKKRGLEIDLRLRRLFDLKKCDFDLGRVNCISLYLSKSQINCENTYMYKTFESCHELFISFYTTIAVHQASVLLYISHTAKFSNTQ